MRDPSKICLNFAQLIMDFDKIYPKAMEPKKQWMKFQPMILKYAETLKDDDVTELCENLSEGDQTLLALKLLPFLLPSQKNMGKKGRMSKMEVSDAFLPYFKVEHHSNV